LSEGVTDDMLRKHKRPRPVCEIGANFWPKI
jgi:hypothetical protein